MKKEILFTMFMLLMMVFAPLSAQTDSLIVEVTGIGEKTGSISIGLFNDGEDFPDENGGVTGAFVKVEGDTAYYIFHNLEVGEYAVAIYHDSNENREMDSNFIGIPTEGYGFSNDATGFMGPPDYDEAKFSFEQSMKVTIEIKY